MEKYLFRGTIVAGFLLALAMMLYDANTAGRMRAKAQEMGVQSVELNLDQID